MILLDENTRNNRRYPLLLEQMVRWQHMECTLYLTRFHNNLALFDVYQFSRISIFPSENHSSLAKVKLIIDFIYRANI